MHEPPLKRQVPHERVILQRGASGYDQMFARITRLFIPDALQSAGITSGALDVATGTGAVARAAAEIVGAAGQVVAGDIALPMVKQACRNLQAHAITLVAPDGQRLPLKDGSFDAVTCHFGLMFLSDPLQGLSEFRRVLGDGGRATISFTSTIPERTLHNRVSIANDMEALIGSGSR